MPNSNEKSFQRRLSETYIGQIDLPACVQGSFIVSPNSRRMAYVVFSSEQKYVVNGDQNEKHYDNISGFPVFSPDSKHLVYIAKAGEKWFVVIDGNEEKHYDIIGRGTILFSPDSKRIAYVAGKEDRRFVVVDRHEEAKYIDVIGSPVFSLDGKRLAYIAKANNKQFLVVNGEKEKEYDSIGSQPFFSPNSKRISYVAYKDTRKFVVVDGKERREYQDIAGNSLIFSPNSNRLLYCVRLGNKSAVVLDEVRGEAYDNIEASHICFSSDSSRIAYVASLQNSQFVMVNDQGGKYYDAVEKESLSFSPNNEHITYIARQADQQFVIVDDQVVKRFDAIDKYSLMFCPNSQHVAFIAGIDDKQVAVMGNWESKKFDRIEKNSLSFSPDGRYLSFVASIDGRQAVVIDGDQSGSHYDWILMPKGGKIIFDSPDSLHYLAQTNEMIYLVEEMLEGKNSVLNETATEYPGVDVGVKNQTQDELSEPLMAANESDPIWLSDAITYAESTYYGSLIESDPTEKLTDNSLKKGLNEISKEPKYWRLIEMLAHEDVVKLAAIESELSQLINPGDESRRIQLHQDALDFISREQYPEMWSQLQIALGNELGFGLSLIPPEKQAEDLEKIINAYEQALSVITNRNAPIQWATVTHDLANAYYLRIRGNKTDNLEQAIALYHQASEVRTHSDMPDEWAETMIGLGNAYQVRIKGDHAENLEQAIKFYNAALMVQTYQDKPAQWAEVSHNLAAVYRRRVLGDRTENLEHAVQIYEKVLTVHVKQEDPLKWAVTQWNLGNVHYSLGSQSYDGNSNNQAQSRNIELAIESYKKILEVITSEKMPIQWTQIMIGLGSAYFHRIEGASSENIETAIDAFERAIQVANSKDMPAEWATIKNSLAIAYTERLFGDPNENTRNAIESFSEILDAYKLDELPSAYFQAAHGLGDLYFMARKWADAADAYRKALSANELIYRETFLDSSRSARMRLASSISTNLAYCLAHSPERWRDALEILEQCRAREISETLALDFALIGQAQEEDRREFVDVCNQIKQYRNHLNQMRFHGEFPEAGIRLEAKQDEISLYLEASSSWHQIQSRLNNIIEHIQTYLPDFMKNKFHYDDIVRVAHLRNISLVFLITTVHGSLAYVVSPQMDLAVAWADNFKSADLIEMIGPHYQELLTRSNVELHQLLTYEQQQKFDQELKDALPTELNRLMQHLFAPLIQEFRKLGITSACLIPMGSLSSLPLHAVVIDQEIAFGYAPSAQSLDAAYNNFMVPGSQTLLTVTHDGGAGLRHLDFAQLEVDVIVQMFKEWKTERLRGNIATSTNVLGALSSTPAIVHFACHGIFNMNNPLRSGLILENHEMLTLKDILEKTNLKIQLMVLSACQTAITDPLRAPDEAIGLPAGFLQAGVAGIIGTLWPVYDLSTMLLMFKFYQLHLGGVGVAQALRKAQIWLRDLSKEELLHQLISFEREWREKDSAVSDLLRKGIAEVHKRGDQPFASPYYWAAFQAVGAVL